MCAGWNARTQPTSPHSTMPGTPPVQASSIAIPLWVSGRTFVRPPCAMLPRSWPRVKLAHWLPSALPDEPLFISWSQNSSCPKPRENYRVAASHPALLSPTTSERQHHQAERCHSFSVSSLWRKRPCRLSLSGNGCPIGPPLRANRQRELSYCCGHWVFTTQCGIRQSPSLKAATLGTPSPQSSVEWVCQLSCPEGSP